MKPLVSPVRWGVIGAGDVVEHKSGPALQAASGSQLVAVMRRDAAKAADFARRHGVPRWYDDADALINDPDVDAVYIATPPHMHAPYTVRAAAAGKPVYVEKPMARTAAECRVMLDACAAADVPLFVAYYRRAMPRFETVARLLAEGAIGEPCAVRVTLLQPPPPARGPLPWRLDPEISGGGLFVDLGSHTLDLLDHLLGPLVARGGASSSTDGVEDVVSASLEFASGVRGVGLWAFGTSEHLDEVEIVGSGGSLQFSSFGTEPLRLRTPDGERLFAAPYPNPVQLPLVESVVAALTGSGECPSTGESALRTAEVVDTLLEGIRATPRVPGGN